MAALQTSAFEENTAKDIKEQQPLYDPSAEHAVQHKHLKGPGYAVLLVMEKEIPSAKGQPLPQRNGAMADQESFTTIFQINFGMDWINKSNFLDLSLVDWDHNLVNKKQCDRPRGCICCQIRKLNFDDVDKFVLVISAHGKEKGEPVITMADGKNLRRSDIIKALGDERCPNLKGKLRIVIWCACRKNPKRPEKHDDEGVYRMQKNKKSTSVASGSGDASQHDAIDGTVDGPAQNCDYNNTADDSGDTSDFYDEEEEEKTDSGEDEDDPSNGVRDARRAGPILDVPMDFLFAYSVPVGRAKRHTKTGSWLLNEMTAALNDFPSNQNLNFLELLIKTNDRVCKRESTVKTGQNRSGLKNTICIEHRLCRKVLVRRVKPALPAGSIEMTN